MPTQTLRARAKATKPKPGAATGRNRPLTLKALNRATLARQHLITRSARPAAAVVADLAGMQAQMPGPPFVGLWSRMRNFSRQDLIAAINARDVVRGTMMRGTLHLMAREDFLRFRLVVQPLLSKALGSVLGGAAKALDTDKLVRAARRRFSKSPCSFATMRQHLVEEFPGLNDRVMGFLVRMELPLVQVPEAGADWGYPSAADFAVADAWLGCPLARDGTARELVLRYLAAFGPASPRDFQVWSGLQGAKALFDDLASELVALEDEDGSRLFDLPDAPRPDEGSAVPVRYLPGFDNLVLAYHDRRRVIADANKPRVITKNLIIPPTFMVDGVISGTWNAEAKKGLATLLLQPFAALGRADRSALVEEGEALLEFLEPSAASRRVEVAS